MYAKNLAIRALSKIKIFTNKQARLAYLDRISDKDAFDTFLNKLYSKNKISSLNMQELLKFHLFSLDNLNGILNSQRSYSKEIIKYLCAPENYANENEGKIFAEKARDIYAEKIAEKIRYTTPKSKRNTVIISEAHYEEVPSQYAEYGASSGCSPMPTYYTVYVPAQTEEYYTYSDKDYDLVFQYLKNNIPEKLYAAVIQKLSAKDTDLAWNLEKRLKA